MLREKDPAAFDTSRDSGAMKGEEKVENEGFTVGEAIDAIGFGWYQLKMSLFTGMLWMADAMEMMLMAFLAPAAKCEFDLTDVEMALISTIVFVGIFFGATAYGWISDHFGRHRSLLISSIFTGIFGVTSAFSPSYALLIVFRFLVGFNLASLPQSITYFAEFLPSKSRSRWMIFVQMFWAIGTMFESLLAMAVMPNLNWRYLLGLSSVPILLAVPVFALFPKSPYFLISIGDYHGARRCLERVAMGNGKVLPAGNLVTMEEKSRLTSGSGKKGEESYEEEEDRFGGKGDVEKVPLLKLSTSHTSISTNRKGVRRRLRDLFSPPKIALTTILLWGVWMSCAFSYYGVVLLTTEVLSNELVINGTCVDKFAEGEKACYLTTDDYLQVLWTTAAEIPGVILTVTLMDTIGRRRTLSVEFAGVTTFYALLFVCNVDRIVVLVFIFCIRGLITGAFQASYVYTPEVYPTHIRSFGLGCCSSMARIGAGSTPFVAQVVFAVSLFNGKLVYTLVAGFTALVTFLFPYETKGKAMGAGS